MSSHIEKIFGDDSADLEEILRALLREQRERMARVTARIPLTEPSFPEWVSEVYYIKDNFVQGKPKVRPIGFENHPYLKEIYGDSSESLIIMKASQIGASEFVTARAIYLATRGLTVAYFLPTLAMAKVFNTMRFDRAIALSPPLRDLIKRGGANTIHSKRPTMNTVIKQIGDGFVYLGGCHTPEQTLAIAANALICDEYDRFNPEAELAVMERLAGSPYKYRIYLSKPSFPDYGVHAAFLQTDMREYHFKCRACGRWGPLEVPHSLARVQGEWQFVCRHCGKALNRFDTDVENATWVITNPKGEGHGYHVPATLSPARSAEAIFKEWEVACERGPYYVGEFNRSVQGIPYLATDQSLTLEIIDKCISRGAPGSEDAAYDAPAPKSKYTVMGVDVGRYLHVAIIGRGKDSNTPPRLIFAATVGTGGFDRSELVELSTLIKEYDARFVLIDPAPEPRFAMEVFREWPNRVKLCKWDRSPEAPISENNNTTLTVGRNYAYDSSFDKLRSGNIRLPQNTYELKDFVKHMLAVVRVTEETGNGEFRHSYRKIKRHDHFMSAFVYAVVALEKSTKQHMKLNVMNYAVETEKYIAEVDAEMYRQRQRRSENTPDGNGLPSEADGPGEESERDAPGYHDELPEKIAQIKKAEETYAKLLEILRRGFIPGV